MAILKLIRFPNLLIVFLSQLFIYHFILKTYLQKANLPIRLDFEGLLWVSFTTLVIAAAGYIINDIFDRDIDALNKRETTIIGNKISLATAYKGYAFLVILGLLASIRLYIRYGDVLILPVYIISNVLLYCYSSYFKKTLLWGNLIVALYCAFTILVVFVLDLENLETLAQSSPLLFKQFFALGIGYSIFAFLSTFYREIVKDIEDIPGDAAYEAQTLAVAKGMKVAKQIAFVFGVILLSACILWAWHFIQQFQYVQSVFLLFLIIFPIIYTLIQLRKAKQSSQFHRISTHLKIIMVMGIFFLIINTL